MRGFLLDPAGYLGLADSEAPEARRLQTWCRDAARLNGARLDVVRKYRPGSRVPLRGFPCVQFGMGSISVSYVQFGMYRKAACHSILLEKGKVPKAMLRAQNALEGMF